MRQVFIILRKEISTFFSSPMGYIIIGVFLLINSAFLWIFKGNYNVLNNGFSDLYPFFDLSPWLMMFLVPAITMKSFSEELKTRTIEILLTKPLIHRHLVIGKFLGSLTLVFMTLIPTLLYVYSIWELGHPIGNISIGSTVGSYMGLVSLALVFVALGEFTSTFSDNQVVAYLLAVLGSFLFYYGFEGLSDLGWKMSFFSSYGLKSHFQSMSRGVLDTRDLIYFLSLTAILLIFTEFRVKMLFT